MVEKANDNGGEVSAQMFPRPIGLVIGLELSGNPFVHVSQLPGDRAPAAGGAGRRDAQTRSAGTHSGRQAGQQRPPADVRVAGVELHVPARRSAELRAVPSDSIGARARARGVDPLEEAYDRCLDDDGHAMLLVTLANFRDDSLDTVGELLRRDDVVLGLGDGGAHYGMICDASFPTYMLAHWARDRRNRPADRRPGRARADLGAGAGGRPGRPRPHRRGLQGRPQRHRPCRAAVHKPVIAHDLPAGGRRLDQSADGYVATVVSGEVIAENGVPTEARPGKLVRGRQPAPSA